MELTRGATIRTMTPGARGMGEPSAAHPGFIFRCVSRRGRAKCSSMAPQDQVIGRQLVSGTDFTLVYGSPTDSEGIDTLVDGLTRHLGVAHSQPFYRS